METKLQKDSLKPDLGFSVTLQALREARACYHGYNQVVRSLQGKPFTIEDCKRESYLRFHHSAPVPLTNILASNGLSDALWAARCLVRKDRDLRMFAVWCARQVQDLITDPRSLRALDVAGAYAEGKATEEELTAARAAAVCDSVSYADYAARNAARAIPDAAAYYTAYYAACADLRTRPAQSDMFIKMCQGQAPWQLENGHV